MSLPVDLGECVVPSSVTKEVSDNLDKEAEKTVKGMSSQHDAIMNMYKQLSIMLRDSSRKSAHAFPDIAWPLRWDGISGDWCGCYTAPHSALSAIAVAVGLRKPDFM